MKEARMLSKFRRRKVRRVRRWIIRDFFPKKSRRRVQRMRASRPWGGIERWQTFSKAWSLRPPYRYKGVLWSTSSHAVRDAWGRFFLQLPPHFVRQSDAILRRLMRSSRLARLLRRRRPRRKFRRRYRIFRRKARRKGNWRVRLKRLRIRRKAVLARRKAWIDSFFSQSLRGDGVRTVLSPRHSLLRRQAAGIRYRRMLRRRSFVRLVRRVRRSRKIRKIRRSPRVRKRRRTRKGRRGHKRRPKKRRRLRFRRSTTRRRLKWVGGARALNRESSVHFAEGGWAVLDKLARDTAGYRQNHLVKFRRYLGSRHVGIGLSRGGRRRADLTGETIRRSATGRIEFLGSPLLSGRVLQGLNQRLYSSSITWRAAAITREVGSRCSSYFPALTHLSRGGAVPSLTIAVQDCYDWTSLFPWWFNKLYGDFNVVDLRGGMPSPLTLTRYMLTTVAVNESMSFASQIFPTSRQLASLRLGVTRAQHYEALVPTQFLTSLATQPTLTRGVKLQNTAYPHALALKRRLSYYRQVVQNLRLHRKFDRSGYYPFQLKWGLMSIYIINFSQFRQLGRIRVRRDHPARSLNVWIVGHGRWWGGRFHTFRTLADRYVQYEVGRMGQQDYYLGSYMYRRYRGSALPFTRSAYMTLLEGSVATGDVVPRNTFSIPGVGLLPASSLLPTWGGSQELMLTDIRYINTLFQHPVLLKYFLWSRRDVNRLLPTVIHPKLFIPTLQDMQYMHFSKRVNIFQTSNLWPTAGFSHTIRRRLLKVLTYRHFSPEMTMWVHHNLVRFMEAYSGRKVYLQFNAFAENFLTYHDLSRCYLWEGRLRSFQRMLGARIFVNESLRIFYLALKSHDPKFLAIWIREMLYRLSFWKSRLLFRYIKYIMRYLYYPYRSDIGFRGFKLTLRGKIAVAGNARTRTLIYSLGDTSNAKMNNRVVSHFTTVNSFTGVMGFNLLFYF